MPRELKAMLAVLVVLAVAWLGYGAFFGDDSAARFTIETVSGTVRRVDDQGATLEATRGQILRARDRIVAEAGGRAVLSLGADSRVTVEELSTVQVLSVTAEGVQLELEGGRVHATVRPGAGRVGIGANGRGVTAEDADFDVVRGDDGTFGVEAERGSLTVEGIPGTERIGAGERLIAPDGGSAQVTPASEELLLSVAWPEEARTRAQRVEVRGRTAPRARVSARGTGGVAAGRADANGDFVLLVDLAEGENVVNVEATSVLGDTIAVTSTFVRDTKAPSLGVEIRY